MAAPMGCTGRHRCTRPCRACQRARRLQHWQRRRGTPPGSPLGLGMHAQALYASTVHHLLVFYTASRSRNPPRNGKPPELSGNLRPEAMNKRMHSARVHEQAAQRSKLICIPYVIVLPALACTPGRPLCA